MGIRCDVKKYRLLRFCMLTYICVSRCSRMWGSQTPLTQYPLRTRIYLNKGAFSTWLEGGGISPLDEYTALLC